MLVRTPTNCQQREGLQSKENQNLGPNASLLVEGIVTKCLKRGKNDENRGPTMVQGEWQMDEQLVGSALRSVMLLDNVIDVSDG